jgi:hypothetical protein
LPPFVKYTEQIIAVFVQYTRQISDIEATFPKKYNPRTQRQNPRHKRADVPPAVKARDLGWVSSGYNQADICDWLSREATQRVSMLYLKVGLCRVLQTKFSKTCS